MHTLMHWLALLQAEDCSSCARHSHFSAMPLLGPYMCLPLLHLILPSLPISHIHVGICLLEDQLLQVSLSNHNFPFAFFCTLLPALPSLLLTITLFSLLSLYYPLFSILLTKYAFYLPVHYFSVAGCAFSKQEGTVVVGKQRMVEHM